MSKHTDEDPTINQLVEKLVEERLESRVQARMEQLVQDALRTEPNYEDVVPRLANIRIARLLHVAMGLVTEAGEFVDQLKRHIYYGNPLDRINLEEELGDVSWYQRVGVDELECRFLTLLDRNVAKLRARFPEKFSEEQALNRNLQAEANFMMQSFQGTLVAKKLSASDRQILQEEPVDPDPSKTP